MAGNDILVSVKIITYNHENYIAKALESVLMQNVSFRYEIVIGEDCSTDKTREIVLEYQREYPGIIKLVLHEKNVGMIQNGLAVNRVLKGKYVAVLDGDDYWTDENKLQTQITLMQDYPDCDISFHPAISVYDNSQKRDKVISRHAKNNRVFAVNDVIIKGGAFCPTSSLVMKAEVLEHLPDWFSEVPVGDYFMQILGSQNGGALYIDKVMSAYNRFNVASWTNTTKTVSQREAHLKGIVSALNHLNHFFQEKYKVEIDIVKSEILLHLAKLYLKQHRFHEFNDAISKSYVLKHSMKKSSYFYLKKYPKLLLLVKAPGYLFNPRG